MSRIKLTDTTTNVLINMSEGNPGALTAMMELIKDEGKTDPDSAFGGFGAILSLDSFGIYGTDIYVLWSDICGRDIVKMQAVLRACQLGLFPTSTLTDACSRQDYSGRDMIPVDELYEKVKAELPNFDSAERTTDE